MSHPESKKNQTSKDVENELSREEPTEPEAELSDDDLDDVAGGWQGPNDPREW